MTGRTAGVSRPVPVADELSEPYWRAAADHVLALPRCSECGLLAMPPDVTCPHCGSTSPELRFEPVTGRGVIRSWTVMRQSFLPGFAEDVPFVLVDVELAEQTELRLIGRLLDGPDAPLTIGAQVQAAFEDVAAGVSVPAFTLVDAP
jgi:uncharacterized OB-fold protein